MNGRLPGDRRETAGSGPVRSLLVAAAACATLLSGCRQDMHDQPKMIPQRSTTLFADGRSARPQVVGTVARSQGADDSYFRTGMVEGKEGDGMPFAVTTDVVERGQERYNIYCSPCHSRVGNGLGMIVQRGYRLAGNFHTERLREAPLGHFFNVITNGFGAMPNYAAELSPEDRWAVVSYIRALQLSQNATRAEGHPSGEVPSLTDLAAREGLPESFAAWRAPAQPFSPPAFSKLPTPAQPAASLPTAASGSANPTAPATPATAAAKPGAAVTAAPPATAAPGTKDVTAAAAKKPEAAGGASAADVAAGQQLYAQNCQVCHQPTRTGMPPMVPSLVGIVGKIGPARIHTTVSEGVPTGKPPMPAFSNLSKEDIDKLIAFLGSAK